MAWKTVEDKNKADAPAETKAPSDNLGYEQLKAEFERAYNGDITIDEAERLAAKFLSARMNTADEIKAASLDARMRKRGLKALKSTVRQQEISKHDKKPTEGQLDDTVNTNQMVQGEERGFDEAEVEVEHLETYLDVFKDAHVYFRGISKGRYE